MTTLPRQTKTSRAVAIAISAGALLSLALACSVDVDVANKACPCGDGFVCDTSRNLCVVPQDPKPATAEVPACDPCTCDVDSDCKDPARARCSPSNVCVECTRDPDTCGPGSYCNELSQCTLGCKQESDCQISPAAPRCEPVRHQCVECVSAGQCTDGKGCSPSGKCVESCDAAKPCAGAMTCCGGFCLDTEADLLNCGGCGAACVTTNGTPKCAAGVCEWTCASGFSHCDSGNTGCETNTRSDLAHCGSCTKNCDGLNANGLACVAGGCTFVSCIAGFGDCDADKANGCECSCGAQKNQPCCPGSVCSTGLTCNTAANKCQ